MQRKPGITISGKLAREVSCGDVRSVERSDMNSMSSG